MAKKPSLPYPAAPATGSLAELIHQTAHALFERGLLLPEVTREELNRRFPLQAPPIARPKPVLRLVVDNLAGSQGA